MKYLIPIGLIAYIVGVYGIWFQGKFWAINISHGALADQQLQHEVQMAFFLPAVVTMMGALLIVVPTALILGKDKFSVPKLLLSCAILAIPPIVAGCVAGSAVYSESENRLQ